MSHAQSSFEMGSILAELGSRWGWFVALGVAFLVLGALAFWNLFTATVVSVLFVGIMMIIGAVVHIIHAFRVKRWGGFFFWLLSGILYGLAGFLIFSNPLLGAAALTLLFACSLLAAGLVRAWWSTRLRPRPGWGWILASGLITLLAGIIFLTGWPVNSLWLLGIVLAVDLTFQGVAALACGFELKVSR
ncbi:MAG: HdeD family acid-resistance protein [Candidatus Acidiferrales bacterium]